MRRNARSPEAARASRMRPAWRVARTIAHLFRMFFLMTASTVPSLLPAQTTSRPVIHISVFDNQRRPLAAVTIEGISGSALLCKAVSDANGEATLNGCGFSSHLQITATLQGYVGAATTLSADQSIVEISLSKSSAVQQNVTVHASSSSPLANAANSESKLPLDEAKLSPLRPNTLADALPLVPGVIRTPDGRVQISGQDEEHSNLLINSVSVNDPATGEFGLSVPVDTVDLLKVMQSPFLAQYGSFTAGVVSAETRRGGDKWDYSLNDPLPDFRIRSGHLVGLRDAAPRLNFGGPLVPNHLYLLEGSEYLVDKAEVRTLSFPVNESRSEAFNSFTQIDALLGHRNTVTGTLHFAPHTLRYANLNYFDPQPVTPNADYQEDTGTISDRFAFAAGLLASTFAGTRVATNVAGQAQGEMVLTPQGNSGNYFGQQSREATRFQWLETWNPALWEMHGRHAFQLGTVLAHAEDEGQVTERDVQINDASGQLLRTISYSGNGVFSLADLEFAAYAQDHWMIGSHFAVDAGIRWETQSLTYTNRTAPRAGATWTPRENGSTLLRGGIGVFYDSVPLDTYAFSNYPQQVVTTYDGHGNITDGPRRYQNVISTGVESEFPFIDQQIRSGNFAPYSVAWNIEAEQRLNQFFMFRVHYIHSDGHNQLTLTPEVTSSLSALVLADSGESTTRQTEFTVRAGANSQRQFFFSYVRQSAYGDLTDASSYLGDFPFPVVRSPITAGTAGEIPNRFLLWGSAALPWKFRIAPHIEYRNGYTWQPVNQSQNYIDFASYLQPRYPRYFSADARFAKDLNLGPRHAIRLSVTSRNLTNHDNPLQIHNNTADPAYGTFFGNYGRHFLLDFDFLF